MSAVLARLETGLVVLLFALAGRMARLATAVPAATEQPVESRLSEIEIRAHNESREGSATHFPQTAPQLTFFGSVEHRTFGTGRLPHAHCLSVKYGQGGQSGFSWQA